MTAFDPVHARARLLELVRARAYQDGLDVVLASGKRSDFYIHGKKVTLHPEGLWLVARLMLRELETMPAVTAVGGLTLGADPIAAAVCALSHETGQNLSAFLVRTAPKRHGSGGLLEGELAPGQKVAIVEDTITTGGSARRAIEAVRQAGAEPLAVLAIADREDDDAAALRAELEVRALVGLTAIREGGHG